MTAYIPPTSGTPDLSRHSTGGQMTQTNGNPWAPGTFFSGPVLAGTVQCDLTASNTLGGRW